MHRHHPALEGEVRSVLQFGGEAARGGADGAAAAGAAARRDPPDLSARSAAGEVRPSGAPFVRALLLWPQNISLIP